WYISVQVNIWLSTVSFHAYSEITFDSTSDVSTFCDYWITYIVSSETRYCKLFQGGKGITDLEPALQVIMDIFGEILTEKEQFLQTFSTERNFIRFAFN
ncbi:hypothetical protein B296_00049440, partial [Ensete ventricosum]